MLIVASGKKCTEAEYARVGRMFSRVVLTKSPASIIEGVLA